MDWMGRARFLKNLSRGTLFDGFTELQVPARQSPGSGAVRADAFAEQDKTKWPSSFTLI